MVTTIPREISNSEDVIDSRDVVERLEFLKAELEDACHGEGNDTPFWDWVNAMADNPDGTLQDAAVEFLALHRLAEQGEGYGDWQYGETLIRETYFEEYAQQLAEDIGAISSEAQWPLYCIDWERAARELKVDYTEIDFDGVSYLMRT